MDSGVVTRQARGMSEVGRAPIWLLDVDGVLNAAAPRGDRSAWPCWRTGRAGAIGSSWLITWAPGVIEAINRLHGERAADIRWLTTWQDEANGELSRLLGLPGFAVVPRPSGSGARAGAHGFLGVRAGVAGAWWKLAAARALLDSDPQRPLIWTDDDLVWEEEARAWANGRPGATLLVAPATDVGLTGEHLAAIEEFCAEVGE